MKHKNTMNKDQMIDKNLVSRAVISRIKNDGEPDKILAKHVKELDTPEKLAFKGTKEEYIPDIIAYFSKEANVYEIELEEKVSVEKWRLFDIFAKKNHGTFYVVVPDELKDVMKKLMKDQDISAGLIYFKTE